MYDSQNIFARIIRGEIPVEKVYEDEEVLAFRDIAPKAPVHLLVIPKVACSTLDDFVRRASPAQVAHFWSVVTILTQADDFQNKGYRVISNNGPYGGQEVPHFHVHLLGGAPLAHTEHRSNASADKTLL